jgi:hypothetical protein
LAVTNAKFGGDGWESNPPRTPQQRPADGFEDRVSDIRRRPRRCVQDRNSEAAVRRRALKVADVRQNGCQLGCRETPGVERRTIQTRASSGATKRPLTGCEPPVLNFARRREDTASDLALAAPVAL